jgi:ribA/ribD-fused uncharacterized protein
VKILAEKLSIRGQTIHVYSDNPFRAGIENPDHNVIKVTVKDLPLSKGNNSLKDFLLEKGLKLTAEIQFGKTRDPHTRELTEWLNGDRMVYVEAFDTPLPRTATVSSSRVRIYHQGQEDPNKGDLLCTKCYGKDHTRSKCTRPDEWCRLCQVAGHKAGEEGCSSVTQEQQDGITTIFGAKNPLSNHYPCTVNVLGHSFASAEHAFLHTKALNSTKPDIADKIKQSNTASEAKRLSRDIPYNPNWLPRRDQVMEEVLRAKVQQVPAFSDALLQSANDVLVGAATGDFHWGSGLSETHTRLTIQKRWPGRNTLGKLQTKLRDEIKQNETLKKQDKEPIRRTHNLRSSSHRDPPETGNRFSPLNDTSPHTRDFGVGDAAVPAGGQESE